MTRRRRARERRAFNMSRKFNRSQGVPRNECPSWSEIQGQGHYGWARPIGPTRMRVQSIAAREARDVEERLAMLETL